MYMISEYMFNDQSNPNAVVRAQENTETLFDNMKKMANYMVGTRAELLETKSEVLQALHSTSTRRELQSTEFEVTIKVLDEDTRVLFVHSTLAGALVPTRFQFWKMDENYVKTEIQFEEEELQPGESILRFGRAHSSAEFFIAEATTRDGAIASNQVVSFSSSTTQSSM